MIEAWIIERDDGRVFSHAGWISERYAATTYGFKKEAIDAIIEHRRNRNPMFSGERSYCATRVIVDDEGRTLAVPDNASL
jgi:hypothetical protein